MQEGNKKLSLTESYIFYEWSQRPATNYKHDILAITDFNSY